MRVQVAHTLGRQGARHKLSSFADGLSAREWPGGVDVRDIKRNWTGDRLDFSCVASRGFFSLTIRGWLDVADAEVILDAAVPPMLATFVGEDRIREVLTAELGRVLGE
jgi:hypothetical protein